MLTNNIMDRVFIQDLRLDMVIGVYEWERQITQPIYLDIDMSADIVSAANHDDIRLTVNYKDVVDQVMAYTQDLRPELIESLAEGIAQLILKNFQIAQITLSVKKPLAIRDAATVGVTITRMAT